MKNIFWFAFLLLATRLAVGQVPKTKHAEPDLKRFSSSQLRACFDDKTICGADDVYEVSDELIRRLPTLRTDQLVACFDNWKICGMLLDRAERVDPLWNSARCISIQKL
jgi:hypothetical protein